MKKRIIRSFLLAIFVLYLFFSFVPPAKAVVGSVTYTLCAKEENIEVCLDATNIDPIGMDFQELKSRAYHRIKKKVKDYKSQANTK